MLCYNKKLESRFFFIDSFPVLPTAPDQIPPERALMLSRDNAIIIVFSKKVMRLPCCIKRCPQPQGWGHLSHKNRGNRNDIEYRLKKDHSYLCDQLPSNLTETGCNWVWFVLRYHVANEENGAQFPTPVYTNFTPEGGSDGCNWGKICGAA